MIKLNSLSLPSSNIEQDTYNLHVGTLGMFPYLSLEMNPPNAAAKQTDGPNIRHDINSFIIRSSIFDVASGITTCTNTNTNTRQCIRPAKLVIIFCRSLSKLGRRAAGTRHMNRTDRRYMQVSNCIHVGDLSYSQQFYLVALGQNCKVVFIW